MAYYLVFLEPRNGHVAGVSADVWHRVQEQLFSGDRVAGFVAGSLSSGALDVLQGSGTVHHALSARPAVPSDMELCRMLSELVRKEGCTDIFMAATAAGRRLAPAIAATLPASLLAGCTSAYPDEKVCRRYIHSGSVLAAYRPQSAIRIVLQGREHRRVTFSSLERPRCVAFQESPGILRDAAPLIRAIIATSSSEDISEAGIIVAGGRGMGDAGRFAMLEELANLLGGSVGASRSAVDEGWRPHSQQIGQTGKSVAPELYIACGISGAVQHLAGLASARTIVAINSDPYAPVFDVADYGIVGDVREVLPRLTDAVRDVLRKK